MKKRLFAIIVAITTALLGACDARYRDISSDPMQMAHIGQICEVVETLRAHGVTLTLEREKKTDFISIWNPGFTGPEMTFLVPLAPGTKLKVLAARECANCLFDQRLEYEVKVSPEPIEFAGKPAYIRAESKAAPYVRCSQGNAAQPIIPPDAAR
jgi:hypothetical protein